MSGSISRINNSTIDEARIRIYGSVTLSNGVLLAIFTTENGLVKLLFLWVLKNQMIIYQTKEFAMDR